MRRFYAIAVALAVYFAGCSDKPGPVAVETAPVQRRDLLGIWDGGLTDKSREIDFNVGELIPADSLLLTVSLLDYGYSLYFRYVYEGGLTDYSETGDWVCDQRNPGHLTFNARAGYYYRYNFKGFVLKKDFLGDGSSIYSSWDSEFEYDPGIIKDLLYREATLRLFNVSGLLNFGEFTLLKR